MRRILALLIALPALASASAPVVSTDTVDEALARARSEASAAEREAQRLEALAGRAEDDALELRARQAAAAQAIAAAEARISAADAETRLLSARLAAQREALRRKQAPATSLLAGLTMMARRPPLLAIADGRSAEDMVRVRVLLDATIPAIRSRTAALSRELAVGRRLEQSMVAARARIAQERDGLADRQRRFAELEKRALSLAAQRGGEALGAGDVALARGEQADQLQSESGSAATGRRLAAELAGTGLAPPRPFAAEGPPAPPLVYRLPSDAVVAGGFGEISRAGIRSRGVTLATRRGQPLESPADGTILFVGPYRRYDGVIIIDHGGGWRSLILNARTILAVGQKLQLGQQLGHALGPISVELSQNGRHVSPALIAGSSAALSKGAEKG